MPWYDFYVGIGRRPVTAKIELKRVHTIGLFDTTSPLDRVYVSDLASEFNLGWRTFIVKDFCSFHPAAA
jgi:hypothetical protein